MEAKEIIQVRDLEAGTQVSRMEEHGLLACSHIPFQLCFLHYPSVTVYNVLDLLHKLEIKS